ncbi:MAG: hypothetical protein OXS47_13345 [Chloroflexota bacterium]|nr:hypothetical protein [Chloroflexota bacterium]
MSELIIASFIGTSLALLLAYLTKLARAGTWTVVRSARSQWLTYRGEVRRKRRVKWVREQRFHMTHLAHLANTADEYRLRHTDCWTHAMWNAFWGATRELWERGIREELHYPGSDVHVQLVSERGLGLRVRGGTGEDRWHFEHHAADKVCGGGSGNAPEYCVCGQNYYDHNPYHWSSTCLGPFLPEVGSLAA